MKKNIIIGVLSIISLSFLLFIFVQKTQNEELRIQLREAEKMAEMYHAEALAAKELAEKQLALAQVSAHRAELAAKRAMEAAEKAK